MMFLISPLLAVVAFVTVPGSIVLIRAIGGRAGPRFVEQWRHTGAVNGQAEEVFTGHAIVKSFGRHRDVERRFADDNEQLYEASFAAQFMSSLIQPAMTFMGNIQYVLIAVVGGLRISAGAISIGDMQAMIQYARSFSEPLTRLASMATTFQSGIASLERVLELLDADEQSVEQAPTVDPPPVIGRVVFDDVHFSYSPDKPLIEGLDLTVEPGQTIAIVGPTGAGKTTLVNLIMRFYDLDGRARSASTDATSRRFPARSCGRRSAWCCRTPGCSAARSARTSPTAIPTPARTRSSRPPGSPTSTGSSTRCPTATTR